MEDKCTPSLSWGYGLSPSDPTQSSDLLAIAWDKSVILMSLFDIMGDAYEMRSDITATDDAAMGDLETRQMKQVGFYVTESPISSVQFLSDSLLAVFFSGNAVKVLDTEKFLAGQL